MTKVGMMVPVLLFSLWLSYSAAGDNSTVDGGSDCDTQCGNLTVPYPFGIGNTGSNPGNCFQASQFNLTCNISYQPPKLFWGGIEVSNISLQTAEMTITVPINYDCDNSSVSIGRTGREDNYGYINLNNDWSFGFSQRNIFMSIGCNITSTLRGYWGRDSVSSCSASCSNNTGLMTDGYCDGFGCCQLPISARGVKRYTIEIIRSSDDWYQYSRCGFGFVVDRGEFEFKKDYLYNYSFYTERNQSLPVVLDWAVRNITCNVASSDPDYACKDANALCINSTFQPGYLCSCKKGFEGNPYRQCLDVNECNDKSKNNCTHFCHNEPGSYRCSCPRGMLGDGRKDGSGCKLPVIQLTFGVILIIVILVFVGILIYCYLEKKRLKKLKAEYFYQNGGSIHNKLSSRGAVDVLKVYQEKEIKKATNNYSEVIGEGGYGVVYKGYFPECGHVAVKKSKKIDENQVEEFINELAVLYRMNHKNVVRLLGCSLDAKSPILVYEFIDNGTLAHRLHHTDLAGSLPFEKRLTIALETAAVLGFLHSDASVPIIHGDIKSANILLDSNLNAKVSDFGTSKLVPSDQQAQVETIVKGTPGYLDPEYLQTSQLTDKSDVYSFGVVLVELLTGRRPISGRGHIVGHFMNEMRRNRLSEVVEPRVWNEGEERVILSVGRLAERCLQFRGDDRPTMKEVAAQLQQLVTKNSEHSWRSNTKEEEKVGLVGQGWDKSLSFAGSEHTTTEIYISGGMEMVGGR